MPWLGALRGFHNASMISTLYFQPFKDIMTLTDVQEGIIVRCIQQLSELLRSIKDGAKIFGERDLPLKMDQAIQVIKRDIVFAPSLYTT